MNANINVTLNFNPIPSTALAMMNQKGWVANLGGYFWLIFEQQDNTFTAAFRTKKPYQGGISSNPITVIKAGLESFDKAAEVCAVMFMKMASPASELIKN